MLTRARLAPGRCAEHCRLAYKLGPSPAALCPALQALTGSLRAAARCPLPRDPCRSCGGTWRYRSTPPAAPRHSRHRHPGSRGGQAHIGSQHWHAPHAPIAQRTRPPPAQPSRLPGPPRPAGHKPDSAAPSLPPPRQPSRRPTARQPAPHPTPTSVTSISEADGSTTLISSSSLSLGWYSPRSRFSSSPGCGRRHGVQGCGGTAAGGAVAGRGRARVPRG